MGNITINADTMEPVRRLPRDLVLAASSLSIAEARYLVGVYYQIQQKRNAAAGRLRSTADSKEPHDVLRWLLDQNEKLEGQIARALDSWTDSIPVAVWAKRVAGIDPVIAAGLAAHIDIKRCPTVGRIWRFAGLDPTVEWLPNTKRPWNADLKRIAWLIGESFVRASGTPADFYGKLYAQRKAIEQERNEARQFAEQARLKLERCNTGTDTEARKWYEHGKLPPAHIHARAKRWVVKIFISHYHHVAWQLATGQEPPKPYVISIMGHAGFVAPPNFERTGSDE